MCCSLCMFMLVLFYSLYCLLICLCVFFLLIRRPPRSTRTDTLFPYTTLFRSACSRKSDPGGLISGRSPKLDWRPARDPLGLTGRAPYIWGIADVARSEEHTSELQSLMRISYAVFCLKNKKIPKTKH